MRASSGEHSLMRQRNLGRIARAVRAGGTVDQSTLAETTGLAAGAVSSLATELVEAGVLVEVTGASSGRGRPRRVLSLEDTAGALIGACVTRLWTTVTISTVAGRELHRVVRPTPRLLTPADAGELIAEMAAEAQGQPSASAAAVISIPGGVVQEHLGSIELGWAVLEVDSLLAPLRERGVQRISVQNDGNLAALAETRVGAGRGVHSTAVILLTEGIGGGATLDAELMFTEGWALGFGHVPLAGSPRCKCGRTGCLELFSSLRAIAGAVGEGRELESVGDVDFARMLEERAHSGEQLLVDALGTAKAQLMRFCEIVSAILNVDQVVITGAGGVLLPWVADPVVGVPPIPIRTGLLGAEAPLRGAAIAAQDLLFAQLGRG